MTWLVGEREERLREALETIYKRACATWTGEASGDPLHIALASIAHTADAALASSPSPPDPDIVYKVEALILEHERNVGAFFATDQRTVERRQAAKRIVALFGPPPRGET